MAKFRKKPVEIEAVQFEGFFAGEPCFKQNSAATPWLEEAFAEGTVVPHPIQAGKLQVKTLEGEHIADPLDWIIQGVKGELYPCKPDIFELTYEPLP